MNHSETVRLLAQLAASSVVNIFGPSIADVRAQAEQVAAAWPGVTYQICPDPIGGRITATLRAVSYASA
jgi:hypothetical protein